MTSLSLFEAKLEAFETRMDANLRALFKEFRLGRSPSPRRSQHGANSDYKKNPSEIRNEDKTWQPYTSTTLIFFVQLQEGHLNQDARSMRATSQPKAYKPSAPINYKNLDEELTKIRQTSTIQEYQIRFERLTDQTRDWSEKQILRTFIEGLKSEIQEEVKARQPYTLKLNQLWVLMQCSLISDYFHDFTEERTTMLKVFLDDELGSTAHNRKKEQEKGIHMTPTTMMPSISMLALPERGNVFVFGADISRVGIGVTLMQDGRLLIHTETSPTLHTRFLKGILIATKFKIWLDTGPWHEIGVSPTELLQNGNGLPTNFRMDKKLKIEFSYTSSPISRKLKP
ncbi:hypothetical protein BHE74_00055303 [Ensete ventricosum]|nr:hypothetical protein BHE74_00055303 [Ensete ventricosum]